MRCDLRPIHDRLVDDALTRFIRLSITQERLWKLRVFRAPPVIKSRPHPADVFWSASLRIATAHFDRPTAA